MELSPASPASPSQAQYGVSSDDIERLDKNLDVATLYFRAIHYALRSIYSIDSPFVASFKKLKEVVQPDAVVFKQGLQPLSLKIFNAIGKFFDNYLDQDLVIFRKRIAAAGAGATEMAKLCEYLSGYYLYLTEDFRSREATAKKILDELLFEARWHAKALKVLKVKSNIQDHIFLPLILVHSVGCYATPFALKNEDSSNSKRVCAKSEGEGAVAACWVLSDTAVLAADKICKALKDASFFFKALAPALLKLANAPTPHDEAWDEATEHQYELIKEKAFRLQMRCYDPMVISSLLDFDLDCIPSLEEGALVDEHTKQWLDLKEAPAEMELRMTMISASGLPSTDPLEPEGGSDPYCVAEIQGKKRSRVKTGVVKDTLEPVWNFETQIPDYAAGDDVIFTIWDKDFGKKDDLLGRATLPEANFISGFFEGEIPVDCHEAPVETPHTKESFLKVRATLAVSEGTTGVLLADKIRDATEDTEVTWALDP